LKGPEAHYTTLQCLLPLFLFAGQSHSHYTPSKAIFAIARRRRSRQKGRSTEQHGEQQPDVPAGFMANTSCSWHRECSHERCCRYDYVPAVCWLRHACTSILVLRVHCASHSLSDRVKSQEVKRLRKGAKPVVPLLITFPQFEATVQSICLGIYN